MRHLAALAILLLCASDVSAQRECIDPDPTFGSDKKCMAGSSSCTLNDIYCTGKRLGDSCGLLNGNTCQEGCLFFNSKYACCVCAKKKKMCTFQAVDKNNLKVTVQLPDVGVQSIGISTVRNLAVSIPLFSPGTRDPVNVTASKLDPALSASLDLLVCPPTPPCTTCDPLITLVTRDPGKPAVETFTGLPHAEHFVTFTNGAPGLKNLLVVVNGMNFRVTDLGDNEEQTLDVSIAMRIGNENLVQFQAFGKPGASATVVLHD
jgi:hypothetical protein